MRHRKDEFNILVWGSYEPVELMHSEWDMVDRISKESERHLKTLGYKARVHIPPSEFGNAADTIFALIDSIPNILPFFKLAVLFIKMLINKYDRSVILQTGKSAHEMNIELWYHSERKHWIADWDPDNAAQKLNTMLDAAHHLSNFLKIQYPNIRFSQNIQMKFECGQALQSYAFLPNEDTALNIARYKLLSRQTTFEKNKHKHFSVTNKLFIKRSDTITETSSYTSERVYYFLIPSILLHELASKYQIAKYKLTQRKT